MPKFCGDFGLIEITEGKPLSFHSCVNTGLMLPSYLLALMWQALFSMADSGLPIYRWVLQ
jgi:hypothetical protein